MSKPCSRCGRSFGRGAWSGLDLLDRIPTERVRELVTSWPGCEAVEVRGCPCGQALARKVDTSATEGS